ncbi:MAG: hypothetical protein LBL13_12380 [Bacteroidales bacterium]|jgi:hypothetical protein|nr:hypothetical protein [Bacteroidales bacterium]
MEAKEIKEKTKLICNQINKKGTLKMDVFKKTEAAFDLFKKKANQFSNVYHSSYPDSNINVKYESSQSQTFSLQFGSDILFFVLHSNVFEFNRDHELMKTPYIRENKDRAYCGMISIYNFLSDSLYYNRYNDTGYLIGRIFINFENHCYIDGKRELAQIYNNFNTVVFDEQMSALVLDSAIQYAVNFDLLVPPYEMVKEITIQDMLEINNKRMPIKTAKRLGFRFQADTE